LFLINLAHIIFIFKITFVEYARRTLRYSWHIFRQQCVNMMINEYNVASTVFTAWNRVRGKSRRWCGQQQQKLAW